MSNFKDILKLIGNDTSKVFVINEQGDVKFVILGVDEYQKLLLEKVKQQVGDIEEINRRIVEAQLHEPDIIPPPMMATADRPGKFKPVDLRSEVIDPSFNFTDFTSDAEAIKPNFDDI